MKGRSPFLSKPLLLLRLSSVMNVLSKYRLSAIVIAVTSILGLLSGCTPSDLDTDKLETIITAEFSKQTDIAVESVDCPKTIKLKSENSFDCQINAFDGKKLGVIVSQDDGEGNISWDIEEGLIHLTTIEKSIQAGFRKRSVEVTADCGSSYKIAQQGDTFSCDVRDDRRRLGKVRVDVSDSKGNVTWKLLKS